MTSAEFKLWEALKGKQVLGFCFRAQHPIDIFIADFYCHPLKLVIEVDGGIHNNQDQKESDIGREAELENLGIKVMRFSNEQVEDELTLVIDEILQICHTRKLEIQCPL